MKISTECPDCELVFDPFGPAKCPYEGNCPKNPLSPPKDLKTIMTKTPDFHPGLESYHPERYMKGGGVCALEDASDLHAKCGKALKS